MMNENGEVVWSVTTEDQREAQTPGTDIFVHKPEVTTPKC